MKKVKFILALLLVGSSVVFAQKNLSDNERIAILPYVSSQVEYLPTIAKNNLQSKLAQIVSSNGYGQSIGFSGNRFIITPNISVLTKDITEY